MKNSPNFPLFKKDPTQLPLFGKEPTQLPPLWKRGVRGDSTISNPPSSPFSKGGEKWKVPFF